ncbi:MAG: Yip1 family protein, partial [Roseiarcus sp.]
MNVVERVKAILVTPKTEWRAIESEPGDPAYLFTNYVAILAAIPAVAGFIGMTIFGRNIFGSLVYAIVSYLLTFVTVYVVALIADALAPTFGARKDQPSALKLVVYSMTP